MANHLRREPFDRDREFTVTKGFTLHGRDFGPGDPFNKYLVTTRRLRQMFDSRLIKMNGVAVVVTLPKFDPDKMSDTQLTLYLEDHGVVPRFGAGRDWLLKKVRELSNAGAVEGPLPGAGAGTDTMPPAPALERVRLERA